jgi:hypothetical protein
VWANEDGGDAQITEKHIIQNKLYLVHSLNTTVFIYTADAYFEKVDPQNTALTSQSGQYSTVQYGAKRGQNLCAHQPAFMLKKKSDTWISHTPDLLHINNLDSDVFPFLC